MFPSNDRPRRDARGTVLEISCGDRSASRPGLAQIEGPENSAEQQHPAGQQLPTRLERHPLARHYGFRQAPRESKSGGTRTRKSRVSPPKVSGRGNFCRLRSLLHPAATSFWFRLVSCRYQRMDTVSSSPTRCTFQQWCALAKGVFEGERHRVTRPITQAPAQCWGFFFW